MGKTVTKTEEDRMLLRNVIFGRWAPLCDGQDEDDVAKCGLCSKYAKGGCAGCPIMEKTGKRQCHGTPFWSWRSSPTETNARVMTVWLWEIYDELTVKMLAERDGSKPAVYVTKAPVVLKAEEPLLPLELFCELCGGKNGIIHLHQGTYCNDCWGKLPPKPSEMLLPTREAHRIVLDVVEVLSAPFPRIGARRDEDAIVVVMDERRRVIEALKKVAGLLVEEGGE